MNQSKDKMIQNLKDADCTDSVICRFMAAVENGNKKEAMQLLAVHRQELLDQFHKSRGCIDCLDYLISQIEKENH